MAPRPHLPSENVEISTTAPERASRASRTHVGGIDNSTDIGSAASPWMTAARWQEVSRKTPAELRAIRAILMAAAVRAGLRCVDFAGMVGLSATHAKNLLTAHQARPDEDYRLYSAMRAAELAARTQPRRKPPRKARKCKAVTPP
jgi:hypothetical protein